MKHPVQKGIRLGVFFILLFALITSISPAGGSQASKTSNDTSAVISNNWIIESVKLAGLYQPGDPPGVDPELIKKLKKNSRGEVSLSTNTSTEYASFVRITKSGDLHPGNRNNTPQGKANGFFGEYGGLFGVKNANTELTLLSTFTDKQGGVHLSYQQKYKGVPVFAAILQAHTDANNQLSAMNGVFVPDISVNTSPAFSAG